MSNDSDPKVKVKSLSCIQLFATPWTAAYQSTSYNWTWNNRLVLNRKGVRQGCILSPCLFNFYAEYIMQKAGLDEAQAGIKISGRNINNLRYADDTTLMAESQEELKNLLVRMKGESERVGLKVNIQKTQIRIQGEIPITS